VSLISIHANKHRPNGVRAESIQISSLTIAGWTGRDREGVDRHIRELAELGVKPPSSTPCYYTLTPDLLTSADVVSFCGKDSSGEAEFVIISMNDGLWVGLGSDHTDRRVETYSVTVSKQMCRKPIGSDFWALDDVVQHWDELIIRSYVIEEGGRRLLYQEGAVSMMRTPRDLIVGAPNFVDGSLPTGAAMFCGTLAAIGGIRPAERFEMELHDPVLGRTLQHAYTINNLVITGE
jgi:Protein of unknown function (DUF2848)